MTPGETTKWRERDMKASSSAPAILLAPLDKDRVHSAAKSVMKEEKIYRVTRRPLGGYVHSARVHIVNQSLIHSFSSTTSHVLPAIKVRRDGHRNRLQDGGAVEQKELAVAFHESVAADLLVESRVLKKLAKLKARPYMRKKLSTGNFSFLEIGLDKRGATRRRGNNSKEDKERRLSPVYLRSLFKKLQVEVTKTEFVWLMRRLDPNKVGGVRAEDLIRVIEDPDAYATRRRRDAAEGGVVEGEGEAGDGPEAPSPSPASKTILSATADSHGLKQTAGKRTKRKLSKKERKRKAQEKREHREAMEKVGLA